MDDYSLFPLLSLAIVCLIMLVVAATSWDRRAARVFLLFCFMYGLQVLALAQARPGPAMVPEAGPMVPWERVAVTARLLSPAVFLWFVHEATGTLSRRMMGSLALLGLLGILQLLQGTGPGTTATLTLEAFWGYRLPLSPIQPAYSAALMLVAVYSLVVLRWRYRNAESAFRRATLKWIGMGASSSVLLGVVPPMVLGLAGLPSPVWLDGLAGGVGFGCLAFGLVTVEQRRLAYERQRERARYRALYEVLHTAMVPSETGHHLQRVLDGLRQSVGAKSALLYLRPGETPWSGLVACAGSQTAPSVEDLAADIARQLAETATIDIRTTPIPDPPGHLAVGTPVRLQGVVAGCVLLLFQGHAAAGLDTDLLAALADQVSLIIAKLSLEQQRLDRMRERMRLLTAGQEEERARLSREIHDGPIQSLAAISTMAELCLDLLEKERERCREVLTGLAQTSRSTMQELRSICRDLRPGTLDHLGLVPTIKWYAQQVSKNAPFAVEVSAIGADKRLPPPMELAVFRVVQEALTNASKHAAPRHVSVDVHIDGQVEVTIRDDGRGFRTEEIALKEREGHLGLVTMRERVEQFGGILNIRSAPQRGTVINVQIPLGKRGRRQRDG